MILLIDNYDSFTWNLVQLLGQMEPNIKVVRNDEISIAEIEALAPEGIVLSPGPGRPEDAGICMEVISSLKGKIPILGVCLGHQAIVSACGGQVSYAPYLMHGKQSLCSIDASSPLFHACPAQFKAARYHSLAAVNDTMPDCLKVTAQTEDGVIMAVEHKDYPVYGLQFHPESILTPDGMQILENFLHICKEKKEQETPEKPSVFLASQSDLDSLIELRMHYIHSDGMEMRAEMEKAVAAQLRQYFQDRLNKSLFAFCMKRNGQIASTAFLLIENKPASPHFVHGKTGKVMNVFTLPEYRRKGYATQLMQALLEFGKVNNLDFVELKATESGFLLYQKLGFQKSSDQYQEMKYEY